MLRTSDYTDVSRLTINGRYSLVKQIGSGSFGKVYLGLDKESDGEEVAIKLEPVNSRTPLLKHEYKVYKRLNSSFCIPRARWFGEVRQYNALVMDLLGPSLEQLFQSCNCRFTIKTVLMLADQMIARIEVVHCKSLLHRDIKPENFLMGTGKDCNKVYLIDFGLASVFRDRKSRRHIHYEENRSLIGTTCYASINNHLGVVQSRRDDMESLGYTLLYFLRGKLPWQGLAAKTKRQKYEKIAEMKMSTSVEELCKELPFEFERYLNYCRSLRFEEQPNYTYLRQLFRILFRTLGHKYDYMYDWTSLNKKTTNSTLDANTATTGGAAETPTYAAQMTRAVAEPDSSTAPETRGEVEGVRITAPGTRAEAKTPTIAAPGKRAEAEADTASFSSGTRSEDKTANIPKAVAETPRIAAPGTRAEADTVNITATAGPKAVAETPRIAAPGTRAEADTVNITATAEPKAVPETPRIAAPGTRAEAETVNITATAGPEAVAETPRIAAPKTRAEAETASSIAQTKTGCSNCDGGHWTMRCPFVDKDDRQRRIGNNVKHVSANQGRIMKNYSMDECITMLKEAELRRKEEAKEYEQFRELVVKTSLSYRTSLAELPSKSDDVFGDWKL